MARTAQKESTRSQLIETGIDLMLEKGYNNTGLSDVLNACGVPKGSFYYYFKSKEEFGLEIIKTFDQKYVEQKDQILTDTSVSAVVRLRHYVNTAIEASENLQCSRGCLIANLSQEMADQNEIFRECLCQVVCKRRDRFASVMQQGIDSGEIRTSQTANDLAEFFLCTFNGAMMRSKVRKNAEPLHVFKRLFFDIVLQSP
jgi:TetR/AcrR family transcriptional repressor of nem operon